MPDICVKESASSKLSSEDRARVDAAKTTSCVRAAGSLTSAGTVDKEPGLALVRTREQIFAPVHDDVATRDDFRNVSSAPHPSTPLAILRHCKGRTRMPKRSDKCTYLSSSCDKDTVVSLTFHFTRIQQHGHKLSHYRVELFFFCAFLNS